MKGEMPLRTVYPVVEEEVKQAGAWSGEQVSQGERQSRTLAALRDALLPKLVSGEIRLTRATSRCKEPA